MILRKRYWLIYSQPTHSWLLPISSALHPFWSRCLSLSSRGPDRQRGVPPCSAWSRIDTGSEHFCIFSVIFYGWSRWHIHRHRVSTYRWRGRRLTQSQPFDCCEHSPSLNSRQDSTGGLPDWVTSFIHRVIQLLENLPEEGPEGSAGGATEGESV